MLNFKIFFLQLLQRWFRNQGSTVWYPSS